MSDRVRLPETHREHPIFSLLATLEPQVNEGELVPLPITHASLFRHYRYHGSLDNGELHLTYRGRLNEPSPRMAHGMPIGVVSEEGVYLDGAAGWYPAFAEPLQSYRLSVELPPGWKGVSGGVRQDGEPATVWESEVPQEDIYLLAGPFSRYQCRTPTALMEVFLLNGDAQLAQRYLETAGRYLALYDGLLGDYPYDRFAVVENRWQTGYGMPSFTLLGSRVLRLPFILHSSLPHEIVHNWWGNGVFLSQDGGNWSEGLTAYLADHLIKEMQGQGAEYRRKALERYANFAASGKDFPLRDFRARHDDASQAVGYSKALMLYHMLRRELGDKRFLTALQHFYRTKKFKQAGFDDLLAEFAEQGLADVPAFRRNWLERPGAPVVELQTASVEGGRLTLRLRQTQAGAVYPLSVPVAVTLAGETEARWVELSMTEKTAEASWQFAATPRRVDVDPAFDLFRQLLPGERPASLGRLFGSAQQFLVLPSQAADEERQAWLKLAGLWQQRYRNVRVIEDTQIDTVPADAAVWLLGWDNRVARSRVARFSDGQQALLPMGARVGGKQIDPDKQAVVLLDPDNARPPLGFVAARGAPAIERLAGKLTHYGSFGRLLFDLPGVQNSLREGLEVTNSPLSRVFGDTPVELALPAAEVLSGQLSSPRAWREVTCR